MSNKILEEQRKKNRDLLLKLEQEEKLFNHNFEQKNVSEWNKDDVESWIQSLKIDDNYKNKLIQNCNDFGMKGSLLIKCDRDYFMKEWELSLFESLSFTSLILEARIKHRSFNNNSKKVKITFSEPDVIDANINDKSTPRAIMDCGHAITCVNLYNHIISSFTNNICDTDIYCPSPNCNNKQKGKNIIWDWSLCCEVANLSAEEMIKYDQLRMDRALNKIYRACPQCKKICEKPELWAYLRVNCGTGCADFCWNCACKWESSGLSVCTNPLCDKSEFNKILQNCAMKSIPNYADTSMPSIRACPKCKTIIEHIDACKHMTCGACKADFCFICLGIKANGKWPCSVDNPFKQCTLAPKQYL